MNKKIILLVGIFSLLVLVGCVSNESYPREKYCKDVGFDSASRDDSTPKITGRSYIGNYYVNFKCVDFKSETPVIDGDYYNSIYFYDQVKELGQAICDQKYNKDFDYYFNKKLVCKPKPKDKEEKYDGITVIQMGIPAER